MKYNIIFDSVESIGGSYFKIKIKENVLKRDSIGDMIGVTEKNENQLWFSDFIELDNDDVVNFIKEYFNNYRYIVGIIRRITQ